MLDIGYCVVIVAFFVVAALYVRGLEKLRGGDHE